MAIELANHIYRDGEGVPVVLMNAYPVDHRMWYRDGIDLQCIRLYR